VDGSDALRSEVPAVAGLPAQRPPQERSAGVLRSVGLDALVELVEDAPVPLGVTGEDGREVYVNAAGRRLLGRGADAVRGAVGDEALALVVLEPAGAPSRPDGSVDDELRRQAVRAAAAQERHRLGRDLHDSVSSALFALHTRTQVVDRALAAGDLSLLAEAAKDMQALSGQAIAELRSLVSAMRDDAPGAAGEDADDLATALERLAATTLRRDGLEVQLRIVQPLPAVPAETAEHLVRIAAEAVHNCVKHAGVSRVRVGLEVRGSELVLTVADEGRGFDPSVVPGGRHGQRTMRERAVLCGGWLAVDTAPGRGTRVVARVPLPG
jgi:signal transduction histidine kinase